MREKGAGFRLVDKSVDCMASASLYLAFPLMLSFILLLHFKVCSSLLPSLSLNSDKLNWPSMTFLRSSLSTLVQSHSPSQGSLWIRQPRSLLFGTQLSCPRCKEIVHDIFCSALNVRLWDQGKCQDWWTMGTWSYFLTRVTDHPSVG